MAVWWEEGNDKHQREVCYGNGVEKYTPTTKSPAGGGEIAAPDPFYQDAGGGDDVGADQGGNTKRDESVEGNIRANVDKREKGAD